MGFRAEVPVLQRKITISIQNQPLKTALEIISREANFDLAYASALLENTPKVTLEAPSILVEDALRKIFENTRISFKVIDSQLISFRKKEKPNLKVIKILDNKNIRLFVHFVFLQNIYLQCSIFLFTSA